MRILNNSETVFISICYKTPGLLSCHILLFLQCCQKNDSLSNHCIKPILWRFGHCCYWPHEMPVTLLIHRLLMMKVSIRVNNKRTVTDTLALKLHVQLLFQIIIVDVLIENVDALKANHHETMNQQCHWHLVWPITTMPEAPHRLDALVGQWHVRQFHDCGHWRWWRCIH